MSDGNNEQTELLREILKWVRFASSNQVKGVLESTLNSDKKRVVYHLSDGNSTSRAIGEQADVDFRTISEWWKEWTLIGLGDGVTVSGGTRFRRSFDIKMYGMTVPSVKPKGNAAPPVAEAVQVEAGGAENV
jgi:hypothetical protein